MDIVIMIAQFVLSLSLLIVLHELGHFIPARLFKTRVEKFYLFFDFWLGSLFKFKRGDTEYGIGWLPLGGYVKIAGMIDESNDKEFLNTPPQPWEFRSKPAWQRLIIMLGGVTVNFLLGIFIMIGIVWYYGEQYVKNDSVREGIFVDSLGKAMGLKDGDLILKSGGKDYKIFNDRQIKRDVIIDGISDVEVQRDGKNIVLPVPTAFSVVLSSKANRDLGLFGPRVPNVVDSVMLDQPGGKAGLLSGDKVLTVNEKNANYRHELAEALSNNLNKEVTIGVLRGADTLNLKAQIGKTPILGVMMQDFLKFEDKKYSLAESIPLGYGRAVGVITDQFKAFGRMFNGGIKAKDSLGGFATMANLFGTTWDWKRFWSLTAMISMILAFMNLLPIPALDGGHVVFLLFEAITGIKPSDKVLEYAGTAGFFLVLLLLVFANGNDLVGCLSKK